MRALKFAAVCILLLSFYSFARAKDETKTTFNSFKLGPALPLGNSSAITSSDSLDPNMKKLKPGWEASWTFFGKPFLKNENVLSGLAFGGKISYSSWRRDSTLTPVTFLGVQGIARYYIPPIVRPLDIFAEVGAGWFLGEYGFSDADSVDWNMPDYDPVIKRGQNCLGINFGAGADIDVVEILPLVTVVATKKDLSIWFSLNLGMTF